MAAMQVHELSKVEAPIYYAVGNHDFDYFAHHQSELPRMTIPFV